MAKYKWQELNEKWKQEIDRQSMVEYGMTAEEYSEFKRQEKINSPGYIPPVIDFNVGLEKYDKNINFLENGILQSIINGGRVEGRSIHTFCEMHRYDDYEEGYDY